MANYKSGPEGDKAGSHVEGRVPALLPGMPRVVPPTWCDNSLQGRGELCPSLFCGQRNQGVQCLSLEGKGYSKGKMLGSCERWIQRANLGVATPHRKSNLSFFQGGLAVISRILTQSPLLLPGSS